MVWHLRVVVKTVVAIDDLAPDGGQNLLNADEQSYSGSVWCSSNPADRGSVGVPMRPMLKLTPEIWQAISEYPIL